MPIMRIRTVQPNKQELRCSVTLTAVIWWMIPAAVVCGMLHPALDYRYRGQLTNVRDQQRADTSTTTTLLTIDDATISFLFKVKLFPFRLKTALLDGTTARASSGTLGNTTPSETGVVAFGIDLGLPGSLGGVGYGHNIPIETFSISSVRVHAKSLTNNVDVGPNEF